MEPEQARHPKTARVARGGTVALVGMLLTGTGSAALAANNTIIECDSVTRRLQSLEVTHEALSVNIVEHMATDTGALDFTAAADDSDADTVAPVLLLTPRVANILKEVFDTDVSSADTDDVADSEAPQPATEATPLPPVAKDDGPATQVPANIEPILGDETASRYMPRFQRQMYRTDI